MKQIDLSIKLVTADPTKSEGANEAIELIIPIIKNFLAFNKTLGKKRREKFRSKIIRKYVDLVFANK